MKTESPAPSAVELLLLAALVALALTMAGVALPRRTLKLSVWRTISSSPARSLPPPPALHPLALVAEELAALPVAVLRPMAGTRSKRVRKAELVAAC